MALPYSVAYLCAITADLLARNEWGRTSTSDRSSSRAARASGCGAPTSSDSFVIFHVPMGKYLGGGGIRCCVSPWRRPDGNTAPDAGQDRRCLRGHGAGAARGDAAGFDEAITLTVDGHVAEGTAENIFLVMDGKLVTPSLGSDMLAGITRASIIELAAEELGLRRSSAR